MDGRSEGRGEYLRELLMEKAAEKCGKGVPVKYGSSRLSKDAEMLQARCFAAEWIGSELLEKQVLQSRLRELVGNSVGLSYCVGCTVRDGRAHYGVVVRSTKRVRLRSARAKFVKGHTVGKSLEKDDARFAFRLSVPEEDTDAGLNGFVLRAVALCERLEDVSLFNEGRLLRVQERRNRFTGVNAADEAVLEEALFKELAWREV